VTLLLWGARALLSDPPGNGCLVEFNRAPRRLRVRPAKRLDQSANMLGVQDHAKGLLEQPRHSRAVPPIIWISMRSGSLLEHAGQTAALRRFQPWRPATLPGALQRRLSALPPRLKPLPDRLPGYTHAHGYF